VNAAGNVIYDRQAPFALGTVADAVPGATGGRNKAVFCRIGANIAIGGAAGIANGVSGSVGTGNNYVNDSGVALVIGDYAWLTAAVPTS
jgi:hypothetical protein